MLEWWMNIPFLSIMLAMLCAILCAALPAKYARRLTVTLTAFISLFSGILLIYCLRSGESFLYSMGEFPAPWGNELRCGILEALLSMTFSLVMLLSLLGGLEHIGLDIEPRKQNLYFTVVCLVYGAILALAYTNDIFTAYVFVEISTLSACGLLMIRQLGRTTLAAVRYMIISLLGSGLFLIGITLLFDLSGHLLMEYMHDAIGSLSSEYALPLGVSLALMVSGLAVKSGLFPFYFWMPDTYGFATTSSACILSGLVSKGYIVLLLKVFLRVASTEVIVACGISDVLFVFSLCSIVAGSLSAIRQKDITRMIAYSSAAQLGYIFLGISLGTTAGYIAAAFQILTHAVTKPLLFVSASALSDASGRKFRFHDLQGAGYRDKLAGIGFAVGSFSMVGLPIFSGFITKMLVGTAAIELGDARLIPTLAVLVVSTVLNAVYFLRTVIRIYMPPIGQYEKTKHPISERKVYVTSVACFTVLNILLGLFSQPVCDALARGIVMFS